MALTAATSPSRQLDDDTMVVLIHAGVAELADARDSKVCERIAPRYFPVLWHMD
jgi:hypothetical protein